jgi:hypothetical protein
LIASHRFEVENAGTAEMALLTVRRVIADEEIVGTLRIG